MDSKDILKLIAKWACILVIVVSSVYNYYVITVLVGVNRQQDYDIKALTSALYNAGEFVINQHKFNLSLIETIHALESGDALQMGILKHHLESHVVPFYDVDKKQDKNL